MARGICDSWGSHGQALSRGADTSGGCGALTPGSRRAIYIHWSVQRRKTDCSNSSSNSGLVTKPQYQRDGCVLVGRPGLPLSFLPTLYSLLYSVLTTTISPTLASVQASKQEASKAYDMYVDSIDRIALHRNASRCKADIDLVESRE